MFWASACFVADFFSGMIEYRGCAQIEASYFFPGFRPFPFDLQAISRAPHVTASLYHTLPVLSNPFGLILRLHPLDYLH